MSLEADKIEIISPSVRRITAGNSSVFTGPGTNTYLIGIDKVTVLDPGPAIQDHIEAIAKCSGKIEQIIVTHTHPDHSPGVKLLQDILDIPAFGLITERSKNQDLTFNPDVMLNHGEIINVENNKLEVIHTPGHASNHLCYLLEEEGMIFTGDHIMNGSTVVISPPDGNMRQYLESLDMLKNYDLKSIAPGHGEVLKDPQSVVQWIIKHRLDRENKVLSAIKLKGHGNADSLVEEVYKDVSSALFPIAKWSLNAHLIKLYEDGVLSREDKTYKYIT
ncbi:MAG: MBL fold metallo-hydrolase [SAR86 cluster bacterium]|jgi:glyoxylase-like metal-dependent hydrolase (beta-lactamase superfamily II)|nr:MBL fold metallo-hydrolase [SAR86 cluster bacterium]